MTTPSDSSALAVLKLALAHSDSARRLAAVKSLADLPTGTSVASLAIPLVSDPDDQVSAMASDLLESSISPNLNELKDLISLLRSAKDGEMEYWAATCIGRLGPAAADASASLAQCLLDSSFLAARERAAWALSQIGSGAKQAINALRQIGPEDPPRLQRLAATALQSIVGRAA